PSQASKDFPQLFSPQSYMCAAHPSTREFHFSFLPLRPLRLCGEIFLGCGSAALCESVFICGCLPSRQYEASSLSLAKFGHRLALDPYAETHVEYQHQIEGLLAETDPELVSLCLDIGHFACRGGDPV